MNGEPAPEVRTIPPPPPRAEAAPRPKKKEPRRAFGLRIWPTWRAWKRLVAIGLVVGAIVSLPTLVELALPRILDGFCRKELGHRLVVGRVDLDLWNGPRILATNVALAPIDGGDVVAIAEDVEVVLGGRELLRGVVIDRIAIGPVRARLDRMPDGRLEPIAAIARAQDRIPKKPKRSSPARFRIGAIVVPEIRILVVDHREYGEVSRTVTLTGYATDLGPMKPVPDEHRPGTIWLTGEAPGFVRRVTVDAIADFEPKMEHDVRLDGRVNIEGAEAAELASFAPSLEGEGRISVSLGADFSFQNRTRFSWVNLGVSDVLVASDAGPRLRLERFEFSVETAPGVPARVRALRARRADVPLERTPEGGFALLGVRVLAKAPPEEPGADPRAAHAEDSQARLLEKLERSLARGGLRGEPASDDGRARPRDGALVVPPEIPELAIDELVLEDARVVLRDRATAGQPELVVEHVSGRVVAPLRDEDLDAPPGSPAPRARTILGHVEGSLPGIARSIALDLEGATTEDSGSIHVNLAIVGIVGHGLDAWLAAGGTTVGLDEGIVGLQVLVAAKKDEDGVLRGRVVADHGFVVDRRGERARLDELEAPFAIRTSGGRSRITVGGVDVNARVRATRARDGLLNVAGIAFGRGRTPRSRTVAVRPREPNAEIGVERLDARVALAFEDEMPKERLAYELSTHALVVGIGIGEPAIAGFRIDARLPGAIERLSVAGRAFTSVVTPALVFDASAALESELVRRALATSGWDVDLAQRTLAGRFALAADRAARPEGSHAPGAPPPPFETAGVLRVQALALSDPAGVAASISSLEVRLRQDPTTAILDLPLVWIRGPHLVARSGDEGVTLARAFAKKAPDGSEEEAEPRAPPPERPERRISTLRIAKVRVEDGSLAFQDVAGRRFSIERVKLSGGPLERGPAATKRPHQVEAQATVPGIARDVRVHFDITPPIEIPRVRATIDVAGIDLSVLRSLAPDRVAEVTVHSGSFHAVAEVQARPLRDGSFSGSASLADVVYRDDRGAPLFGLTEARARILRFDPRTGDLDVSALDVDRPRVSFGRDGHARIVAGGVVTNKVLLHASDEEFRLRSEGKLPEPRSDEDEDENPPGPPEPALERPAGGKRPARLTIDRLTVGGGSVHFVDAGALDERGQPFVLDAVDIDATAERVVLGAPIGISPTTRYEVEARFDDGMRLAADGLVNRHPAGFDGRVEVELRGMDLPRWSRYPENTAKVRLERGYLDGVARVEFLGTRARGEVELIAHRLRIRRLSDNPFVEGMTALGTGVALPVLTDWQGDTQVRVPFRGDGVPTGAALAFVTRAAFRDLLGQPIKIPTRFIEAVVDRPMRSLLDDLFGRKLKAPVERSALFAPGDPRLTYDAARAIAGAVALVKEHGGRQVRLRAQCGPGDRARALREAGMGAEDVRALLARLERERRAREDERRDLAAAERHALLDGELDAARAARRRLLAVEERLAAIDRSLEELADRVESEGELVEHSRAEDALRRLATERVEAVRQALISAGVDPDAIRTRPVRVHHARDFATVPGGGGRVTIEVVP